MAHSLTACQPPPFQSTKYAYPLGAIRNRIRCLAATSNRPPRKKIPLNLRCPRRPKAPPESPGANSFVRKKIGRDPQPSRKGSNPKEGGLQSSDCNNNDDGDDNGVDEDGNLVWAPDEMEAISSLFKGRIPPRKQPRERPLPLPTPYRIRPLGLPIPKHHIRSASSTRSSLSKRVYKNPDFLVSLAREIRGLPPDADSSEVLDRWLPFLRKGSLSLTVRELGHMGLPERAMQTFCWAQKHPQFFPDDRILSSMVEILARTRGLKIPFEPEKFVATASRNVIEAMVRGFIRAGSINLARKLLLAARFNNRTLDPGIHAKLLLEVGKNPDKHRFALALLNELAEMEDLKLKPQDCTAVMKICIRLGRFEAVEGLFRWFKESGLEPSVVMYTTIIHSRYREKKYREAWEVVWEMEEKNLLLDLPAYRVVIRCCVALNDLSRCVRYFSKLKEAGFSPTYDIYRDLIKVHVESGRLAVAKQMLKEVELAGFKLDKGMATLLSQKGVVAMP
ncbi:hypothetical protein ACLOJK_018469 [Asimina triloba]